MHIYSSRHGQPTYLLTYEQARTAVQLSAVQTAEQIDGVLAELAEVRAENMRLATELDAKSDQLVRMTEMIVGEPPPPPEAAQSSIQSSPPKPPAPPSPLLLEEEEGTEIMERPRGDRGDRGDREEARDADTWAAAKQTSDQMTKDQMTTDQMTTDQMEVLALLRGVGLGPDGMKSPGDLEVQTAIGVSLDDVPANQPEVSQ